MRLFLQRLLLAVAIAGASHTGFAAESAANVTSVTVSGAPGRYEFSVAILSPDLGCNQYADWWEVLDESGRLLYRRVLFHSHAGEQPFERSGGPVAIQPETIVWVRGHMRPGGYGGTAYKGSVRSGFKAAPLPVRFAADVERLPPLPDGCAF